MVAAISVASATRLAHTLQTIGLDLGDVCCYHLSSLQVQLLCLAWWVSVQHTFFFEA